ncbi:hypothetical protein H5S09_04115 [Limosilactobacillus sp. STM2_1]|uniref:Uncharacterized protein n=1 Tax=Limosilactobacillus rudii TaxID=2759755 RepID=A0A7W3UK85_9LACO|nr:hypothetical protein [Limosilactobacillus rudii]MBB1078948.1 hypothetical protein [Limosilactobacillus rudii]MBB1097129.1 hypothetical protein [Limosilactobacillus rudii]MCD7134122.1 hypothetical protein [Limosilactobacillus rudii]
MGTRLVSKVSEATGILVAIFVGVLVVFISLGMLGMLIGSVTWLWKTIISWWIGL